MKKFLAFALSLVILLSALSLSALADDKAKIDHRRLEKYGQVHYYLGEPIKASERPNATDGKVSDGEYVYSTEFSPNSDKDIASLEEYRGYTDTEWVKMYMSHDGEFFYLAFEVKDKVYYPAEDYFMINIGARDGGSTIEGVSRVRYDFKGDATSGVLAGNFVKTSVGTFYKNMDGSWGTMPKVDFNKHVGDRSLSWDSSRGILTLEAVFDIQAMLDCWGNDKSIEDAEFHFVPLINMGGGKTAGSSEMQNQGRIAHYFDTSRNPEIRLGFVTDYPEITYWFNWAAHIVHFSERPAASTDTLTTAVSTGADTTTASAFVVDPDDTVTVKVTLPVDSTVDDTAVSDSDTYLTTVSDSTNGCSGVLSIAAISIIPLCAAVLINKKKDD